MPETIKPLSLYELTTELTAIEDAIVEAAGELSPELEARLDQAETDLARKVEGCCSLVRHFEASELAIEAELARLHATQVAYRRAATSLRDYVLRCLQAADRAQVDTARFRVRVRTSQPRVEVGCDPAILPLDWQRLKIEPDKRTILNAWKVGEAMPEGVTVTQGRWLQLDMPRPKPESEVDDG